MTVHDLIINPKNNLKYNLNFKDFINQFDRTKRGHPLGLVLKKQQLYADVGPNFVQCGFCFSRLQTFFFCACDKKKIHQSKLSKNSTIFILSKQSRNLDRCYSKNMQF